MGNYKKYSDEFKQEVLAMVASKERRVSQIERDLDITAGLIYKWQERYRVVGDQLQPSAERAEQAEIRRLKRELEVTRQERDILKKPSECSHGGNREPLPVHCGATSQLSGTTVMSGAGGIGQRFLRLGAAQNQ